MPDTSTANLAINAERLWSNIMTTAAFGGTPKGGVRRLTLSEEDKQVRDWLAARAQASGYEVGVDQIGNMYVQRPGREPGRAAVAIGSHLDTQPTGGKFDGILGVLAGLEVLETLDEAGIVTEAPLCVVNWTNEEGSRFAPGELGSEVYVGHVTLEAALACRDAEGVTVGEALARIGYAGAEVPGARRFAAMVELHIEQGPLLEAEGLTIGVVTAAKGQQWYNGMVSGRESHAGTTPMTLRRDALMAFAELALAAEQIARAHGPDGVGTIGMASVSPGSRNTVPGEVSFSLEFRHPDRDHFGRMRTAMRAEVERIAATRGVAITLDAIWSMEPLSFSRDVAAQIAQAAAERGLPYRNMTSGAGHDACAVASAVPTAMIFVPCKDGVSHNEAESATPEDCAAGANVLLHAVLALAGVSHND
ncbi:MAG: Zn-dependent hydrolase [Chelatococcus sp.]|uniref:Zn-dependent hydrolase n=1 Tax=Chelatococcus sp. TaxID=1953771 RepID=UPI0025B9C15D|nr:Zn-dependent hydrolase [Chelatococcus sp.]MBX3540225.1 Zn-dependent hydrolase [Chelatococcus sp.]